MPKDLPPPQNSPGLDLSVVIPARDEAARLPQTLARLSTWAKTAPYRIEVIIADDGSRDDTISIAKNAGQNFPVRVLALAKPSGAGVAVKAGILAAKGKRVLLCDADGPVPFEEIDTLWAVLDQGFDLAAGSRRIDPKKVLTKQAWHRVLIGKMWSIFSRLVVATGVLDTQCGFKLFSAQAAQAVFEQILSTGFAFHVESLALARRFGFKIAECPVKWRDVRGSRVDLFYDPIQMAFELLKVAFKLRFRAKFRSQDNLSAFGALSISTTHDIPNRLPEYIKET